MKSNDLLAIFHALRNIISLNAESLSKFLFSDYSYIELSLEIKSYKETLNSQLNIKGKCQNDECSLNMSFCLRFEFHILPGMKGAKHYKVLVH